MNGSYVGTWMFQPNRVDVLQYDSHWVSSESTHFFQSQVLFWMLCATDGCPLEKSSLVESILSGLQSCADKLAG